MDSVMEKQRTANEEKGYLGPASISVEKLKPLTVDEAISGWLKEKGWAEIYTPVPQNFSRPDPDQVAKPESEDRIDRGECKRCWLVVEKAIQKVTGSTHRRRSIDRLLEHVHGSCRPVSEFRLFGESPGIGLQEEIRGLGLGALDLARIAYDQFTEALAKELQR
jgi:hypothetical protein